MIGRLKGILVHKQPPWLVVDVHGVGYELEAPMSTFYDLPDVGREVALFVHHAQKEDSVSLYGFLTEPERRLFRDVQKVSGIGARIALAVLSGVSVDEFARLVQTGDVTALTRIPGIGKKTAERMISFQGLANVKEATIATVAPGISEALIATAMGLFAAIPAVWAYNRFATKVERIATRYDAFSEEFSSILQRQAHLEE